MKRFYSLLLTLFFLACTNSGKPEKPKNLISKNKMEAVLFDLYVVSGAKGVNKKLLETKGFEPETYVLTKHNIDSLQFAESNAYYAFDSDNYKSMIENVKSRIEKEKKKLEDEEKELDKIEQRKKDSIKAVRKRKNDSIHKVHKNFPDSTLIKKNKNPFTSKKN
ncbi:MAG: DUF4296 domain-containing protein [Winogradskyella sp.]|uniref:DUF4296 domain-containing protein n=1 Tax=Winogradskyella sp. TaxID=1883156 RepID=UPI0025D32DE8|nr:DUF4296 domain-containing protein [Winogradskyella sp.]NRB60582.1 DUF4296 domain-containing protein [Winogradskyella sp.]